ETTRASEFLRLARTHEGNRHVTKAPIETCIHRICRSLVRRHGLVDGGQRNARNSHPRSTCSAAIWVGEPANPHSSESLLLLKLGPDRDDQAECLIVRPPGLFCS